MAKIKDKAFVAVQQFDGQKPRMLIWSASATAGGVRKEVGEAYADLDEDQRAGWERAKKDGCIRVVKASIAVDLR